MRQSEPDGSRQALCPYAEMALTLKVRSAAGKFIRLSLKHKRSMDLCRTLCLAIGSAGYAVITVPAFPLRASLIFAMEVISTLPDAAFSR